MFAKSFVALAAVASFAVAAPVEQRGDGPPAGWAYGYLEDYNTYHVRYLALNCYNKHDTSFFQDCCRPMLSTENLHDNRADYCDPSNADVSSVQASLGAATANGASATASADMEVESEYCESEESVSVSASASWASKTAAASAKSDDDNNNYVAPAPSSTSKWTAPTSTWTPEPEPTTTYKPKKTTKAAEPKQTKQASNNNGGGSFNGGYATYFYQGGNPGACGDYHGDYDLIVAIDHEKWGSSSYGGGSDTCGRYLTVTNTNNGKSVTAMVADVCPTCANGNSLDLSVGAFTAIATESEGQVPISWSWA